MPHVRLTLVKPKPGSGEDVQRLLRQLDEKLADSPGLLFSMVLCENCRQGQPGKVGRLAVWLSKEEANRAALDDRILAIRSRLRFLVQETPESIESLLEVSSEGARRGNDAWC